MKRFAPSLLPALVLLLGAVPAPAQSDESFLVGAVLDPAGRPVAGAMVQAMLLRTGLRRDTQTSGDGNYQLSDLLPGTYTVRITKSGFADLEYLNVQQSVGLTRTLNVRLSLGRARQQISITEPAADLDRTTAAVGAAIEKKQVTELPLNGRNYATLAALVPGAINAGAGDQRNIRFAGRGRDDTNYTFDGVDATGIVNQAQRGFVRLAIPTGSIAEFRVQSLLYTAESGDSPGGQIIVASAGGSNTWHGNAFEYLGNDVLNARSPFDGKSPAPYRLNQFGADFSGHLVKDRTFFYLNYEGIRQRLGQTQVGLTPTATFRAGASASAPELGPILAAYPQSTSPTANPYVDNYVALTRQRDDENSAMIRVDHNFSDRTTAFIRFNYDRAVSNIPLGGLADRQSVDTRPLNGIAELQHVFSPALINEWKFGFNQQQTHTANLTNTPYSVNVSQFSPLSSSQTRDEKGTAFSWIDNLSLVRARHTFKAGVEIRHVQMNQGNSASGALTYNSLANFALNRLNQALVTAALPLKRQRKTQWFGFAQDEFRLTPTVTLNLGLRYEFYSVFHETQNRAIPFDFATCGGYCRPGAEFSFPNHHNFDPRLAVAWAPAAAHGRTVLRAGAGIYHGDGQLDDQNLPIANDVQRYSLTQLGFNNLRYPIDPFLASATGIGTPRLLDRRRKDAYVAQWGAAIQQEVGAGAIVTASYSASKGAHLLTTSYVNLIDPLTGLRPYPAFGIVEHRGNQNNSSFQAFQLQLERRFHAGWLITGNYMWSHSIDDGSIGGGEADFPQNPRCRACDRASSDQDVRHVFNTIALYEFPFGPGKRWMRDPGFARALLGGWQLSGIAALRSGLPMNVTIDRNVQDAPGGYTTSARPNRVSGVSVVPPTQGVNSWINPAAFSVPAPGTFGNAGRNLVRNPALWQTDLALVRRISVSERSGFELRAQVFNVFNRAQYGNPQANLSRTGNFGRITTLVNSGPTGTATPRQFQFSLRYYF